MGGYYINWKASGPFEGTNKRLELIRAGDAVPCSPMAFKTLADIPESLALLCVKDSGSFQAVALMFSQSELEAFRDGEPRDPRYTSWLLMDRDLAWKLAGYAPPESED